MEAQLLDFRKFDDYARQLAARVHDWRRDDFRLAFARSSPPRQASRLAEIDQIEPGGGYEPGGIPLARRNLEAGDGLMQVTFGETVFRAFGGAVGPIASIVLYNNDATEPKDALVSCYDLPEPVTLRDGDALRILPEPSGVLWWMQ